MLNTLGTADPVATLQEYYQKKKLGSNPLGGCFDDKGTFSESVKKCLWRSTLTCPQSKVQTSCIAPLSLVDNNWSKQESVTGDMLAKKWKGIFGDFQISETGQVLYGKLKLAKKSAALAMMIHVGLEHFNLPGAVTSTKTGNDMKNTEVAVEPEPVKSISSMNATTAPEIASWVFQLHNAGVRRIRIFYRERRHMKDAEWRAQPIQICCGITIVEPFCGHDAVVGTPSQSRKRSRQNAVDKVLDLIQSGKIGFATEEHQKRRKNRKRSHLVEWKEMMDCDRSAGIQCTFPLPRWASEPIPREKGHNCFLYEVNIYDARGNHAAEQRLSIDSRVASRVGIILGSDIMPSGLSEGERKEPLSSSFSFNNIDGEVFTVVLSNRAEIDSSFLTEERFHLIKSFNSKLNSWRQFFNWGVNNESIPTTDGPSEGSPVHRTYLFVPLRKETTTRLESSCIAWDVLEDIHLGRRDEFVQCRFLLLQLISGALRRFLHFLEDKYGCSCTGRSQTLQSTIGLTMLLIQLCSDLQLGYNFSQQEMQNRFVAEHTKKQFICRFGNQTSVSLSAKSRVLIQPHVPAAFIKSLKRKYNLDLEVSTYEQLYGIRYKRQLRFPQEKLARVTISVKAGTMNPFCSNNGVEVQHDFVPAETLQVLSMPVDILFLFGMNDKFMIPLEREVHLSSVDRRLKRMGLAVEEHLCFQSACSLNSTSSSSLLLHGYRRKPLKQLLEEATTLHPSPTYERLEHLGDSVLGFYLALNVFTSNSRLEWDFNQVSEIISSAAKNKQLEISAGRIGLNRLVFSGESRWNPPKSGSQLSNGLSLYHFHHINEGQVFEVSSFSHFADMMESTLAAAHLSCMGDVSDPSGGRITVAVLELMNLPFPGHQTQKQTSWFKAPSPCLKGGYPFQMDLHWQETLKKIGTALNGHDRSTNLKSSLGLLLGILFAHPCEAENNFSHLLDVEWSRVLLKSSLFNTFMYDGSAYFSDDPPVSEGMEDAAILRDSLFHLGSFSLQLMITEELFRINQEANEGELHLLRVAALSDDVVAYIAVKSNISNCLLRNDGIDIESMKAMVEEADTSGELEWKRRGGWILPGGVKEYQRRQRLNFPGSKLQTPRYQGIAGGRLFDTNTKLPIEHTRGLVHGLKSIVGALVLSLGVEATWQLISPLFQETMLLTAEELEREFPAVVKGMQN